MGHKNVINAPTDSPTELYKHFLESLQSVGYGCNAAKHPRPLNGCD